MYLHEHMLWVAMWWFIELIAIVAVLGLLVLELRSTPEGETPEQILKKRLASGEIDPEEYNKRMDILSHERAA